MFYHNPTPLSALLDSWAKLPFHIGFYIWTNAQCWCQPLNIHENNVTEISATVAFSLLTASSLDQPQRHADASKKV